MSVELVTAGASPAAPRAPARLRPAAATGAGAPAVPDSAAEPQPEDVKRAIENANRALVQKSRELTFEFDDDVGRVIVKLIDRNTGEVLRQIPSSEAVQIARLLEQQKGVGALLRTHA